MSRTRLVGVALLALAPVLARAQTQQGPIVATPLPPLAPSRQYPPTGGQVPGQPQVVQSPAVQPPVIQPPAVQPPVVQPPQSQPPSAAAPAPGQPPAQEGGQPPVEQAPPPPNPWLPQGGAVLQVLDKINAQTSTLTVKVGQTATYDSLSISVQACLVRPPDMPEDATAFLTITDSHPDQPGFKGWVLKSDPSLSMLEHPIYDVRVIGCAP